MSLYTPRPGAPLMAQFQIRGVRHSLQTPFTDRRKAAAWMAQKKKEMKEEAFFTAFAALQRRTTGTVGDLLEDYAAAGAPNARHEPRLGTRHSALATWPHAWSHSSGPEGRNIRTLLESPLAKISAKKLGRPDLDAYYAWRRTTITKGTGARTTDYELTTLSNAYDWAISQGSLSVNPAKHRHSFVNTATVKHAKSNAPSSAEELHRIAAALFASPKSEVLGWQLCLSFLTGLRTFETLLLRWDAAPGEPGHIDAQYLHVHRGKSHGHPLNPRVLLTDPLRPQLRPFLEALRAWHREKYQDRTQWFFPGQPPAWDGQGKRPEIPPTDKNSLGHAMRRVCRELGLPHRAPHGLRAYYASVRRAQGLEPDRIAWELGQRSGRDLVLDVYGERPAAWDGQTSLLNWVPTDPAVPVAWSAWLAPVNAVPMHALVQENY